MPTPGTAIIWLRHDLRMDDHAAFCRAVADNHAVIPLYIWSPEEEGAWPPGAASRWWLHQSLLRFEKELLQFGLKLIVQTGDALSALRRVIAETKATHVYWGRRYEPEAIERDSKLKTALRADGVTVESFNTSLLFEPWEIRTKAGTPFKVYTPFLRACLQFEATQPPFSKPKSFLVPNHWPTSASISDLCLEPKLNWAEGMREQWVPGTEGAMAELQRFISTAIHQYGEGRNLPAQIGTSRLSPHLHFGEISPRRVLAAVETELRKCSDELAVASVETFRKEIIWREFAYHLLFHFPLTPSEPLRPDFARMPWRKDSVQLRAWQKGITGYPIVDAGMRELWRTGWMHNRVRMIVASFLVKDLLIPWQEGARWFWDTLVDADLANNTLGWQWTAGCGADAAPFFRIFNPITQGERFDPDGEYVRRWCPELATLPKKYIHRPWEASEEVLVKAGIRLGGNYPRPIVDHAEARELALEAFDSITSRKISHGKAETKKQGKARQQALLG